MSTWIPVIIILFAVALIVGPVMWMKPNARDKRLADLRGRAAAAGKTVQMQTLPASRGKGTAAVYFTPWEDKRRLQLGWILELQRGEHEMHFDGRWDWRNGRAAPEAAWGVLREMLEKLPRGACGVVASPVGLGIQWMESGGDAEYTALVSALDTYRASIEEAIRARKSSGDGAGEGENGG